MPLASTAGTQAHLLESMWSMIMVAKAQIGEQRVATAGQVLDALPDAYVGTDITPVVQFLCAELAAAFEVRDCRVLLHAAAVRFRLNIHQYHPEISTCAGDVHNADTAACKRLQQGIAAVQ